MPAEPARRGYPRSPARGHDGAQPRWLRASSDGPVLVHHRTVQPRAGDRGLEPRRVAIVRRADRSHDGDAADARWLHSGDRRDARRAGIHRELHRDRSVSARRLSEPERRARRHRDGRGVRVQRPTVVPTAVTIRTDVSVRVQ